MKRKLLAGFMAVCLILTLLPATALAADTASTTATSISDGAALKSALENADVNAVITLASDIDLIDAIDIQSKKLTLDMQGHTINYSAEGSTTGAIIDITGTSDVTITGNGSFTYDEAYLNASNSIGYILRLSDSAKLTIENGDYHAGLTCVQVDQDSTAVIKGGHFSADYQWSGRYWHLNKIDKSNATFLVSGGTFENYDPMNSDTENPADNFCAPGYVSVADGENYEVIPAVAEADGKYYATLAEAVADVKDGGTVNMLRDASGAGIGTFEDDPKYGVKDFTIDFNTYTYTCTGPAVGSKGTESQAFHLEWNGADQPNVNVTLKNGMITALPSAQSGVMMTIQNYCNLTLDNMVVDGRDNKSSWPYDYTVSNNCGNVIIRDTTIYAPTTQPGGVAFDSCDFADYTGVTVTVEGDSLIVGAIERTNPNGGDDNAKVVITGGRFSEKPNDAYLKVTGGAFVQDAQGYWTVGSKSGMEAETTTSNNTANVTVGGTFVPDGNGSNVDDEGNTITITAGTDGAATSSTEVAVSSDAMESVSGQGYDVAISTDVATVTVSDAAWDQITENAQGQDVTIAVAKEGTSANPVYVLTAEAGGEEVFSSKNADGTITISVTPAASTNQIYYIREDGSLQNMNARYDEATGKLTWEVTHFSGYGEGSGKVGLVEGNTVSFYDTVSAAISNMKTASGTITLLDNVTENVTIPDGKTIRLELNGKTLTNDASLTKTHTITVALGGALTVQDTVGGGVVDNVSHACAAVWNNGTTVLNGGKYDRSKENGQNKEENGGNSYYVLVNHGEMTINEGVTVAQNGHYSSMIENGYQNYSSNTPSSGYVSGTNAQYPSLTINGGSFSGGLNTVKNDDGGKLEINGGNFSSVSQAVVLNWNEATISGGTFTINEEKVESVILNGYAADAIDQGKLTITGGTFTSNTDAPVLTTMNNSSAKHSGTIDITGGTLNGDIVLTDPQAGGTLEISQGAVINGDIINQKVADVTVSGGTVTGQVTNDSNGTITVTGGTFPNADVSKYVPKEACVISFYSAGGNPVPSIVAKKGGQIELPTCTRDGDYSFVGWWSDTKTYDAGETITVNEDMTFTAQWHNESSGGSSSGSGSSSSSSGDYAITVDAGKHGDVSVSPKRADEGDTVTITVDPDKGYEVDEVIVTDKNGDSIRVRDRGDGEYTFTMPDSKVTVEVTFVEEGGELSFVDVAKSDYYYDAVKWAVDNGVTTGVTDTIFAPGNPCTRAQTVTFLWRAAGMPQAANRVNPFTDVSVNDYYYEAVLWAVENGITGGTTATTFAPNATCTRAQVVTFLWRYSKEDASILPMFTDVAESDYYYGAVAWAVENGVTTGVTDTTFAPGNPCTRGQIVTFLYRYMGK